MTTLSNIPIANQTNSTLSAFNDYNAPIYEISPAVMAAVKGFFTNKDFGEVAAETIATIIIVQCKKDGYNPMKILDSLRNLNGIELSGLVSEILNYNRFKSSSLGYAQTIVPNNEVYRNIIA
jgi:hypothetical protein